MKRLSFAVCIIITVMLFIAVFPAAAAADDATNLEAAEAAQASTTRSKAFAAAITIAVVAGGGALGMGMAVSKSVEGISRQPEADGKIRTTLMLGLVLIETAIIYALIVAILIIFVL